jgi:hypothetical protein
MAETIIIETPSFRLEVSSLLCSLRSNTIDKHATFSPGKFDSFLSAAAWVGIQQHTDTFDSLVLKAIQAGAIDIQQYMKWANTKKEEK